MIAPEKLDAMIKDFIKDVRPIVIKELNSYKDIYSAARSKDCNNKKHSHQYRIKPSILDEFAQKVMQKAPQFEQAKSFDEIYLTVESCRIYKIGTLAIYDTAVRIGHIYRISPQEIYLQRGAKEGAQALGINKNRASMQEFIQINKSFTQLLPHEIECFLCINHKKLIEYK